MYVLDFERHQCLTPRELYEYINNIIYYHLVQESFKTADRFVQ